MNIGEAAERSGLPTQTIRYYEAVGLLTPGRRPNGFRDYDDSEVQKLRFIGCVRDLGFTVEEARELVTLLESRDHLRADVTALTAKHLATVTRKSNELQRLRRLLDQLCKPEVTGDFSWTKLECGPA